jgi:hypothetical protein
MKFIVDIDGTICTNTDGDYISAKPFLHRIHQLNKMYKTGHEIHYWTARGSSSGLDWKELTEIQLERWGCMYTSLSLGKPSYDVWIDDKSEHPSSFFDDCP